MKKKWRKYGLLVALIAAVGLTLLWEFIPLPDGSVRLSQLPEEGVLFTSEALPLNAFERELLAGAKAVKRLYRVQGNHYLLTCTDGSRNRHAVHDPTYCFIGAGYTIVQKKPIPLEEGEGTFLILTKDGQESTAIYWFSDGKARYHSPVSYWLKSTWRRITLGTSGEESLLFVVHLLNDDPSGGWDPFQRHLLSRLPR